MANARSNSLGPGLSTAEKVAGFCYLPFFAVLLSVILAYASQLFGLNLTDIQLNAAFFAINALVVWLIFHRFLVHSFRAIHFWEVVQAVILGMALYYAGNMLFGLLLQLMKLELPNHNNDNILQLAAKNRIVMLIGSVVIAPLVEETLFRGLIFGVLRRKSRILAYAVTLLTFALIHVWQYLPQNQWTLVLLSALQYIPAGIALGWTYEKSNNIWAPILLHMLINAIAFGVLGLF